MASVEVTERARRYLDRIDPAIAGASGHKQAYSAALILAWGFALPEGEAMALFSEWNEGNDPPFSQRDLQHKLRDAASGRSSKKPRGWLAGEQACKGMPVIMPAERPKLSTDAFNSIALRLAEMCPISEQADVVKYLWDRALPHNLGHVFALPRTAKQGAIVAELVEKFGMENVVATGMIKRDDNGEPVLSRFSFPQHRLCVPWFDRYGLIQTVQRRCIGEVVGDKRWVFPAGRGAEWPLGAEQLSDASIERAVIIAEGPGDTLALRWRVFRRCVENGGWEHAPIVVGIPSAVRALPPEWISPLLNRTILVALDRDQAGEHAAQGIMAQLNGIGCKAIRFLPKDPSCKDWSEYYQKKLGRINADTAAEYSERASIVNEGVGHDV